jgi:uncharacterized membrane protein YhhN
VADRRERALPRAFFKMAAAFSFLWAAAAWGATESDYGRTLLVGLSLCALGDALLLPAEPPIWFRLGLGAFLLGHVVYVVAFVQMPLSGAAFGGAVLLVAPAAFAVHRWLRPHVPGSMWIPVQAYVAVIATMLIVAVAAAQGSGRWVIAVGALAFAVSDVAVARDRFVAPGWINGAWGLPLYFGAQLVLASSVSW